jgi:hypothetical protein
MFFKGNIQTAYIEVKCKRCKKISIIVGEEDMRSVVIPSPANNLPRETIKPLEVAN